MNYPAWLARLALVLTASAASAEEFAERAVDFTRADVAYAADDIVADFGNGRAPAGRDFAAIRDGALEVTFTEGKKVNETGLGLHVRVPEAEAAEVVFRIRYPEDFEAGLHGKQIGLSGGRGYDGGRGEEARTKGDGWSVRIQFDATEDGVRNSLYVYHSGMKAKYGEGLGAGSFLLKRGTWHELRLRATMQSAADAADGRIEVWCDGERRIDAPGIRFVTKEEARHVNRVRLELFPGGGGAFPTKDHALRIDDFSWRSWAVAPDRSFSANTAADLP